MAKRHPERSTLALLGVGIVELVGFGRKGWRGLAHLPRQTKNDKRKDNRRKQYQADIQPSPAQSPPAFPARFSLGVFLAHRFTKFCVVHGSPAALPAVEG